MELTREEAAILRLLLELEKRRKGALLRKRDMMAVEKLAFLAAHGEFDESGDVIGVRTFPRLEIDFRVYFRGVHSRDIYEILDRLKLKGLVAIESGRIRIADIDDNMLSIDNVEINNALEKAARYASLNAKELEKLTNKLLGIDDETAKALVFNISVVKLLKAREEARELAHQGLLVDI